MLAILPEFFGLGAVFPETFTNRVNNLSDLLLMQVRAPDRKEPNTVV